MIYLLFSDILLSTAVTAAVVVAKLKIQGILILTSFTLALRKILVTKLVILAVSFSISFYFTVIYLH